jgi:hypothetical protein
MWYFIIKKTFWSVSGAIIKPHFEPQTPPSYFAIQIKT